MHRIPVEIYYEDTDCGGVVYYANYLKYFERGRTALLNSRGVNPAECMKQGVLFLVTRASLEYKSPAVYGDTIYVDTQIAGLKGSRLMFRYVVTHRDEGRTIVTGETDMACVNEKNRPMRIPREILDKLA